VLDVELVNQIARNVEDMGLKKTDQVIKKSSRIQAILRR